MDMVQMQTNGINVAGQVIHDRIITILKRREGIGKWSHGVILEGNRSLGPWCPWQQSSTQLGFPTLFSLHTDQLTPNSPTHLSP